MLTWTDVTGNWTSFADALRTRFPAVPPDALAQVPAASTRLAEELARRHDLTLSEAADELENLMLVQGLARRSSELRAG